MRIKKQSIVETLLLIQNYLSSNKYTKINESCEIEKYHIGQRLLLAKKYLESHEIDDISLELSSIKFLGLKPRWVRFNAKYRGELTPELNREYGLLTKDTFEYLKEFMSLLKMTVNSKLSHIVDVDEEKNKMRKVMNSRQALMIEIERQRKKEPQDVGLIKNLEIQLERLTSTYNELQGTMTKAESDSIVEKNISDKISMSFDDLKGYAKVLEDEKDKIKWEYEISLWTIPFLIVLFFGLYIWFLYNYNCDRRNFNTWLSFMPYTVLIPIFIALMWLCVYLKDRANKISIELSSRLFNIHYLEGLMKLTNVVSSSHEESLKKLDKATESLMDSYLTQVKHNYISEKEVSKLEFKELKSNPYWMLLQKIESVIKLIKQ